MKDLIPISYLNEACFLSLNTDDKKYRMSLKMSQDDLSDILGVNFYKQIDTQYSAFTGAADNATLYEDYIKDYLAWATYFNYLKFANVDATPTGIRTFSDDNSSIATDIQMLSLEKHVRSERDKYKGRMIGFLDTNTTKYPLYTSSCRDEISFAITSVNGKSDTIFKINQSVKTNE